MTVTPELKKVRVEDPKPLKVENQDARNYYKLQNKNMETIKIQTPEWNIEEMIGYKPITTFWTDFSIAEKFGVAAIIDTCKRALREWNDNYKYLTELVMVLNHKIWQWYEVNDVLARIYNSLWEKVDAFACENLHGEELDYFYTTLD